MAAAGISPIPLENHGHPLMDPEICLGVRIRGDPQPACAEKDIRSNLRGRILFIGNIAPDNLTGKLAELLKQEKEKGFETIAVVTRTEEEAGESEEN